MQSKAEAYDALNTFIHEVGIPHELHSDNAKELMEGRFKQICRDYGIKTTYSEPHSPWQNRAEAGIRELKRHVHRKMKSRNVPLRLWDFCCKWACAVKAYTASNSFALEGRSPWEVVMGDTPDISSLSEFDFYEPVWYYEPGDFPEPKRHLARWLGEAMNIGQAMCYYILPASGVPIVRSSVQPLLDADRTTDAVKEELFNLDLMIKEKIGDKTNDMPDYFSDSYIDTQEGDAEFDPHYDASAAFDPIPQEETNNEFDPEILDEYLTAQVQLPLGDEMVLGTVLARKRDAHGNPIGRAANNPIFDTRVYQVQFPDDRVEEYSANVIAENLYSQVDKEGNQYVIIDEIVDHEFDSKIIPKEKSADGCNLCILWKDGSTSWETLKNIKHGFPVQAAEYATARGLQEHPAFKWWVKPTLKRKERIIKAVRTRYLKKTHKYGLRLPKTVHEAYEIDKETGTDYWHKAILKEMKNNAVAFKFLDDDAIPVGYQWIPCHMIFDIKLDLTRKARFVAGGHWTDPDPTLSYSTVVTRDSVRIAFLLAALNEIDIKAIDIGNAYLNAKAREKVYTTAGPEFGPDKQGRPVIIERALYGLKTSGAAWHAQLTETLRAMEFAPSLADPDVWIRAACKEDGYSYYEYLLVYVDDILILSHNPTPILTCIQKFYRLKEPASDPKTYLGAYIKPWSVPGDSRRIWSMSSSHYIKEALVNLENHLQVEGLRLTGKPKTPMRTDYRAELDVSPLLNADQANYYMSLIGILRWAVELGRLDIYVDVTLLSSYMAQPRRGHMEQVLHIFAYLKCHLQSNLVFDPNEIQWDEDKFKQYDWTSFYHDAKESIPPNAPEPRGRAVQINAFCDSDHAGNKITRKSHTGILLYVNAAPVIWYSKLQNTVETSTFGSEFIAMRICVEMIEALRHKLRMFGVPIDGPANVFCDNNSVVINATIPTSPLKKKHNAIAYHRVREAIAARTIQVAKVKSEENLADAFTKSLSGTKLRYIMSRILW